MLTVERYMPREPLPDRRHVWRQKVTIIDTNSGCHTFYVEFGEYADSRLAEVFITSHKTGTFVRGALDSLARSVSLAMQCGTSPHDMAKQLIGQDYPPQGKVEANGSAVQTCLSVADYIGQEIVACYDEDGKRREQTSGGTRQTQPDKPWGHTSEEWRSQA